MTSYFLFPTMFGVLLDVLSHGDVLVHGDVLAEEPAALSLRDDFGVGAAAAVLGDDLVEEAAAVLGDDLVEEFCRPR